MRDVSLYIHLRFFALCRGRKSDDSEYARAHAFGDPLDDAALSGGVAALEDDHHLEALVLHPQLKLHKFGVQLLDRAFEFLAFDPGAPFARLSSGKAAD